MHPPLFQNIEQHLSSVISHVAFCVPIDLNSGDRMLIHLRKVCKYLFCLKPKKVYHHHAAGGWPVRSRPFRYCRMCLSNPGPLAARTRDGSASCRRDNEPGSVQLHSR